ncbi:TetR/AcrR family transcriptional regulator [Pseudonocardia sp. WMMC193]|uniref:TetR/AcrR family transcriptional regulator n=1 Tax=Pseudonocardia sp. WMMC193 TaxID=2911965 RepID=UPI001F417032|nr:TetR/AcrR family transcriptional regulator [Pseudonocardia sp. WMMC193]MCF7547436.1 TetR/AcrR family transcriptional regulator [Pseudonocardia sp. WMMC193]
MPQLWTETIDAHKKAVREAIFAAVADTIAEAGPAAVTMSGVAARGGISRATIYKYFPDVEALLLAWHEQIVSAHLEHVERALMPIPDDAASELGALRSALQAYAHQIAHGAPGFGGEFAARLHRTDHVQGAEQRLVALLAEHLHHGQSLGAVRGDMPPAELAAYCLSAMNAARRLPEPAALDRLLDVVVGAVQPALR